MSRISNTFQSAAQDGPQAVLREGHTLTPLVRRIAGGSSPLLLACVLAVTGCSSTGEWIRNGFKVGPNYATPPAPVADQWIDTDAPEVTTETTNYSQWWAELNDPVLNRLVEIAAEQNLSLQVAALRIQEARAIRGIAVGNLWPQSQQAFGEFSRTRIRGVTLPFAAPIAIRDHNSSWETGFDAAWELDIWGRLRRGIESADANVNAEIESFDNVLVMLQAEVAATYVEMRAVEERIRLAKRNVELQTETLKTINRIVDAGGFEKVDRLDLYQATSDLTALQAKIPTFEAARRQTQNRICVLIGSSPRDMREQLGEAGKIPEVPADIVVGIPADLLRRRPDINQAERLVAAQSALIGLAEAELYPQFSILGTIFLDARNFSGLWSWDSVVGSVGPTFRWNILNYGRIQDNIRVEEAKFWQAVVQYQEIVLQANEETENAIVAFLQEKVRAQYLADSVDAAEKAYQLSNEKYKVGVLDYQRLLDSQRSLVLTQDRLAESRGQVAVNLIAVYKALGGGWETRFVPSGPPAVASEFEGDMIFPPPALEPEEIPAPSEADAFIGYAR